MIGLIIALFLLYNAVGSFFLILWCVERYGGIESFEWDNLNPIYIYKRRNVNWFGAILLTIFGSLLCPIATVGYWFYKLCTVGRR